MVKANAVEYLEKHNKSVAYLCGDEYNRSCGLNGELTDLSCDGCFYKAGTMGRNTINAEAMINYNPYFNPGYVAEIPDEEDLEGWRG